MNCGQCKWWQRDRDQIIHGKRGTQVPKDKIVRQCNGDCRKKRPVIAMATKDVSGDFERFSTVVSRPVTRWPRTTESEWCGEFEMRTETTQ